MSDRHKNAPGGAPRARYTAKKGKQSVQSLSLLGEEIAKRTQASMEQAVSLRTLGDEIARRSQDVAQTEAYTDNILRAQVAHHKEALFSTHFGRGDAKVADTSRPAKPERADKKRRKRHLTDATECTINQPMQLLPPPVRTSANFLCAPPDVDVIGDVSSMEVVSDETGVRLVDGGGKSKKMSKETHGRDIQQSLTLTLQEYFTSQFTDETTADESTLVHRHLHALNGQTCQNSFILNMVMNDRNGGASVPLKLLPDIDAYFANVRPISRAEEERYLRAPRLHKGERECVNGKDCEGFFIVGALNAFALVEYQNPEVREEHAATGRWPVPVAHCIMCRRRAVNYIFFNILSRCAAYDYSSVEQAMASRYESSRATVRRPVAIAPFCNVVGADEYSMWDVIVGDLSQCIPLFGPVVIHRRDKYHSVLRDGEWWYEQTYTRPVRNLGDGGGPGSVSVSSSIGDDRLRVSRK